MDYVIIIEHDIYVGYMTIHRVYGHTYFFIY